MAIYYRDITGIHIKTDVSPLGGLQESGTGDGFGLE